MGRKPRDSDGPTRLNPWTSVADRRHSHGDAFVFCYCMDRATRLPFTRTMGPHHATIDSNAESALGTICQR